MKRILLFIIVVCLVGMTVCKKNSDSDIEIKPGGGDETAELPGVDYFNDDLSEYIEIEEKYYKGFKVEYDKNKVTTLDVENNIIQTLCKHKDKTEVEGDGVISVGDVVHIYYKGYYMNGDEKYFFKGGDNTTSETPHALEIGSGNFITGFEYNLIGKNPNDFTEKDPIVVETFFPEKYQSAELAGKTAYFIVTVEKLVEYNAPELNEAFITETLGVKAKTLSEYEGEDIVAKYKAYVKDSMMKEQGFDLESLILDAFWSSVLSGAVVKKYPEKQLKNEYDTLVGQLDAYYNYYYKHRYERDKFMCLYMGLEVGSDWEGYVMSVAKEQVKSQLALYHIMNLEGLKPTEEEYRTLFDEYLLEALESNNIIPDEYESEEEYLAEREKYKKNMIDKNGEEYYKDMLYYKVAIEAIKGFADVTEIE